MNSLRLLDKRAGYFAVAVALIAAVILPVLASAAQLTERSIALSSSSKAATGVQYTVNFTVENDAGAFVVDFCSNSPVIGQACTAPAGFNASAATSATVGFTDVSPLGASNNTVVVTGAIDASADDEITVDLSGITNPTNAGPLYARIVTYASDTQADLYLSSDINGTADTATPIDQGSVAASITDTVGVSGAVLESMLFCVAGQAIDEDCDTTGNIAPTIRLGETVGDTIALIPTAVSEGSIFTQISTNASSGAVISLKSSATGCGGLLRAGAPGECDILPAIADSITEGQAKFGVMTTAATDTPAVAGATGALQPVTGSGYGTTDFFLGYETGDASGITSTYGDPFLDTAGAPANNKNMQLTFGASVSNDTPAGLYSTDLRLIATGKF